MIRFSKLQGAGNDFIIVSNLENKLENLSNLAKKMCNRHFGIGADGLMAVANSKVADIQMIYYNSDGSRGEMCGNGIRCFSKYVFEKQILHKESFTVETLAGIKEVTLIINEGEVRSVKVSMGSWSFNVKDIPVAIDKEKLICESISLGDKVLKISCVLMGVPHAVIIVDDINSDDTIQLGSKIEVLDIFPKKINVNFVQIMDRTHVKVDTWERGAGKTLACGTGACASVVVANTLGLVDNSATVSVTGGNLKISINNNERVIMEGMAEIICDGEFYL